MTVLPFRRRNAPAETSASAVERMPEARTPSGELPVTSAFVRKRMSNSIEGADEPEIKRIALQQNPMRLLARRECLTCGHVWQQPAQTGACPICHATTIKELEAPICMVLRV